MTMDKKQYIDQPQGISATSCDTQSTDASAAAYIDAMDGLQTAPSEATQLRIGRLDGVITPYWGRLDGYGLMCVNAYLRGQFLLQNGQDVLTQFESMEELIQSEISAFRVEVSEKYNFLSNASFAQDIEKWEAADHIPFFTVGGRFLYFNDNFYSEKKNLAAVVIEGTRRALRLKKATIKQLNVHLARRPKKELPLKDGTTTWPTFYVSFKYKCVKAGTLRVGFEGQPLFVTEEISANDVFETKEFSAVWDGTGDFQISFTGDIYIYSMALIDHPLANYRIETETTLYRLAEEINRWATKTDKIERSIALLNTDLKTLTEQLDSYTKKTDALEQTMADLGGPLEALENGLHLCATYIHVLSETIAQRKSIE